MHTKRQIFSIFQKFEISLLFASNTFEEEKTSKKERRILHFRLARARGVLSSWSRKESVVAIRAAAAWQLLRGGLFCFFEEEEEEKAKKFRE